MIGASTQLKTDLGYFENLTQIQSLHPTGEVGWSAKNRETQTIYVWDGTTQSWIDSGEGFPAEEMTLQDILVELQSIDALWETLEDTNFVTGDSPVTFDCNAVLGRDAVSMVVENSGTGTFTVAYSYDGSTWSGELTLSAGQIISMSGVNIDSIRLTWVSNSSYKITII